MLSDTVNELQRAVQDTFPRREQWISIGSARINANEYTPDAPTAWGRECVVERDAEGIEVVVSADALSDASAMACALGAFVLLDLTCSQKRGDIIMPRQWMQSVASDILSPTQSIVEGFLCDTLLDEDVPCDVALTYLHDVIVEHTQRCLEAFLTLYRRGTIALAPNSAFIAQWELAVEQYAGLYHPVWRNTLVAEDPTAYLLRAYAVFTGLVSASAIDRRFLSTMTLRGAVQYVASPEFCVTYQHAMTRSYEFYSTKRVTHTALVQ